MLKQLFGALLRKPARGTAPDVDTPELSAIAAVRALAKQGDVDGALAAAEAAVAAHPDALAARIVLAETLADAGRRDAAVDAARNAVQRHPSEAEAHLALARVLAASGQVDDALLSMERIKNVFGARADFWGEFGLLHLRRGNLELAWTKLRRAVSLNPRDVSAWVNLAIVAQRRGWRQIAAQHLKRAVELDPGHGVAWTNYGLALRDTDRLPEAIDALRRAAALRPAHPATLTNLASVLLDDEQYDEAERGYLAALDAAPANAEAQVGMALSRFAQGDVDAARDWYARAISAAPGHPLPRVGLAELDLWSGRFTTGWAEYEQRFAVEGSRVMPFPRWDGTPLEAGTLLVFAEQGIGDMMLFANCFPDLAGAAPRIVVEAPQQLVGLFARSFPHLDVRQSAGTARPEWLSEVGPISAAIPAGSLMRLFRPDAAAFPRHPGYLRADPARVAQWRARLEALGAGPRIGVSWQGGVTRTGRKSRSLELGDLAPLLRVPGIAFVSLQYTADAAAQVDALERDTGIVVEHWQDAIDDYQETAALVAALDGVVTCCTAVAHLSSALGRPTRILAPVVASWRYLGRGETLPWYPAARVMRNTERGDWSALVNRAAAALAAEWPGGTEAPRRRVVPLAVRAAAAQDDRPASASGGDIRVDPQAGLIARARGLAAEGDTEGAIALLEDALVSHGDWADGYAALASIYVAIGASESAHDCLELALEHDPGNISALEQAATLLEREGRLAEAVEHSARLAELLPDAPEMLETLARLYRDMKRYDDAVAVCRRCLERWPDRALAIGLLGNSLVSSEHYDEGIAALERYIALSPEVLSAHLAIGAAYLQAGRYGEARAHLEWGLAREPNNATARWDYALVQLADGDFTGGWPNYAYRSLAFGGTHETVHLPAWKGEPLRGERLVVLAEQGLGDEIMFASCLPDVLDRCDDVLLTCDKRLTRIFERSFPGVRVIPRDRPDLAMQVGGRWEAQIGSLPGIFRASREAFPRHDGYLRADASRVAHWREVLAALGDGPKIGVSWRGGTAQTRARLRTIPIGEWGALFGLPGAHFVNLQYGKCEPELAAVREHLGVRIHHYPDAIADYDETAALVASLDLVVTVCTAIVHLTGALGRPVWVLTPNAPEWRYGTRGDSMPWYPTSRMFRQARGEPWAPVLDRVREAADQRFESTCSASPN